MVWPQNDPSTEAITEIYHNSTDRESDHIGKSSTQGEDEDLETQNTVLILTKRAHQIHQNEWLVFCWNNTISKALFSLILIIK